MVLFERKAFFQISNYLTSSKRFDTECQLFGSCEKDRLNRCLICCCNFIKSIETVDTELLLVFCLL